MQTEKFLKVPFGLSKKIQKTLKVSQPTIRKALRGESNTATAIRIRTFAMKNGAAEYQPVDVGEGKVVKGIMDVKEG